jgi:zinc/manganese transport system permease protein
VDAELAYARTRLVGLLLVYVLAITYVLVNTIAEAAQIVGTLLMLSLAITLAAAASRLSARTPVVIVVSIAFALIAAREAHHGTTGTHESDGPPSHRERGRDPRDV